MISSVEQIHLELESVRLSIGSGDLSLLNTVEDTFSKSLLIMAASRFEKTVTDQLLEFAISSSTSSGSLIANFISNKALQRQYHSLFDWTSNNANHFYKFFGDDFNNFMKGKVRSDASLEDSIHSFMKIGSDRNRLVHGDYLSFTMEMTADQIVTEFDSGMIFAGNIKAFLEESRA